MPTNTGPEVSTSTVLLRSWVGTSTVKLTSPSGNATWSDLALPIWKRVLTSCSRTSSRRSCEITTVSSLKPSCRSIPTSTIRPSAVSPGACAGAAGASSVIPSTRIATARTRLLMLRSSTVGYFL
jgi:hypothetical protein